MFQKGLQPNHNPLLLCHRPKVWWLLYGWYWKTCTRLAQDFVVKGIYPKLKHFTRCAEECSGMAWTSALDIWKQTRELIPLYLGSSEPGSSWFILTDHETASSSLGMKQNRFPKHAESTIGRAFKSAQYGLGLLSNARKSTCAQVAYISRSCTSSSFLCFLTWACIA